MGVGQPGFYTMPAELPLSEAVMLAGGPGAGVDPCQIRVERGQEVLWSVEELLAPVADSRTLDDLGLQRPSIIIPAGGDATSTLAGMLESLAPLAHVDNVEVIVVNDAGADAVHDLATRYAVTVIAGDGGGPASARNIGVRHAQGDLLLFVDADCRVSAAWMKAHIEAHRRFGPMVAVGGSIQIEPHASFWARCDHYCSWYNVHPDAGAAWVPNHPSANLSVSRATFERVGPFREDLPRAGVHEETEWQRRLLESGGRIRFEPGAVVWHTDRSDFKGFLAHNYRWGYNSILVKSSGPVSRFPWLYRRPWVLIACFIPFALAHTTYTVWCWLRAGRTEPLLLTPFLLAGRFAYAGGMAKGGLRAISRSETQEGR